MGNCFSDPSPHKPPGKGQTLGSASSPNQAQRQAQQAPYSSPPQKKPSRGGSNAPPQTLGSPGAGGESGDPRERALRAAEERAKAGQTKGVNKANPKAGQLSSKLASERKAQSPQQQPNERMMDAGQWN
ncbi:hypothetical protein IAT38_002103 [Cryptococcus sp. DSM 104549]